MYYGYCATPRLPLPCVPCSSGAPKPAPPPPARPTSHTDSCAPNASATKCANGPCSIWDGTSMPPKATGRRCVGASRRSSAANCNWRPIARRRSNRTPNTSPPSCSPDTPTSAAPERRPKDTTFSKSMWTPWNSSALGGVEHVGLWAMTSSGCARACRTRDGSITARRRHRLDHRPPRPGSERAIAERSALDDVASTLEPMQLYRPPTR